MKSITILLATFVAAFAFAQCEEGKSACCDAKKPAVHAMADKEFMAEAQKMTLAAEGKKACCKSTAAKPMAKGDKGCCNEIGAKAKFKVYAHGKYHFFGCKDSAATARKEMIAKGIVVGKVQPVRSSRTKIG